MNDESTQWGGTLISHATRAAKAGRAGGVSDAPVLADPFPVMAAIEE